MDDVAQSSLAQAKKHALDLDAQEESNPKKVKVDTENSEKDISCHELKVEQENEDTHSLNSLTVSVDTGVEVSEKQMTEISTIGNVVNDSSIPLDPLSYTKNREFTSEIFKIQIYNLPKFGFTDLKKRLKSTLGLNPHKIKRIEKTLVTYVCFRSEGDRDEALKKINGHTWKGKVLEAKIAAPIADPYLQKKLQEKDDNTTQKVDPGTKREQLTTEEAEARLKANVCPFWNMEYSQQLQMKVEKIKSVLESVTKNHFVKQLFKDKSKFNGIPCELCPIIPSPVTTEYRNKNEFTIGYGLDGKTKMVGFRYGLYKDGSTAIGDCTNLGVVMPAAIPVVKSFTEFICRSPWEPYLQQSGTGHWHTLTVRTLRTGDVMAMVDFQPRSLAQNEIEAAKSSLRDFYSNGEGKDVSITSLYFRLMGGKGQKDQKSLELLLGETHVYELLLQQKFRISPEAFFQVNTAATEKLYELIADWSGVSSSTTVLDICCGTGTIGLSLAKKVNTVIGIEMSQPAVEDAKFNASINGITNAVFHCAKVEDIINKTISSLVASEHQDVVAIVDPPRPGLHKDVIRSLRKCESIKHLVYVSCNPESAKENFVDLIRPETGRHRGVPFTMVKATPVDLFPGTKHCELVMLFKHDVTTTTTDTCEVPDLGENVPDLGEKVSDLGENVPDLGEKVSDLGEKVSDLGEKVPDLGGIVPDLGSNVSDLTNTLTDLGDNVPDLGQNVPDLGNNMPDAGENLPDLGQNVPNLENNMPDAGENVPD